MKPLAFAAALLAAWAALATAQGLILDPRSPDPGIRGVLRMVPSPDEISGGPLRTQYPVPALAPALRMRLARAQQQRWAGSARVAGDSLKALLREAPHHPAIVTELARAELQRQDWVAAAQLARSERAATRDSLLAGPEGAMAEERLGHAGGAIAIAVEAWAASPSESDWAMRTLLRLAPMEPRAVQDGLRAAASPRPWREDLLRGRALLLARTGAPLEAARVLERAERGVSVPLRLRVAEDLLMDREAVASDSTGAIEMLLGAAADARTGPAWRVSAARRVWPLIEAGSEAGTGALRLARALASLEGTSLPPDLALALARALRGAGTTREARDLLAHAGAETSPEVRLELLLAEAREGPPARALEPLAALAGQWPGARFALAEARFWCGQPDSALALYQAVAQDPAGPDAGAALERTYLIEETQGQPAIALFGRIAYEEWRGNHSARTRAHGLPAGTRGPRPVPVAAPGDARRGATARGGRSERRARAAPRARRFAARRPPGVARQPARRRPLPGPARRRACARPVRGLPGALPPCLERTRGAPPGGATAKANGGSRCSYFAEDRSAARRGACPPCSRHSSPWERSLAWSCSPRSR